MKIIARRLAILLFLTFSAAQAGEWSPYSDAKFDALTKAGKSVVLDVHADWCPTCQRQQPVLKQLVSTPKYQDINVLVVNFDEQTDARRRFRVAQQSTLVMFKGNTEKTRATGITDAAQIGALLDAGH